MTAQTKTLTCPMCDFECAEPGEIRFHLHTRHSKSDLVAELVEGDDARDEGVLAAAD